MSVYRFRLSFEDWEEVVREIEIRPLQTFEDFQQEILRSVGFDTKHNGSFYMSDDYWRKGQEIASTTEGRPSGTKAMGKCRLCDFIADPHQRIYYVYDYAASWTFCIELVRIIAREDPAFSYPRCAKTVGEAPKQYGPSTLGAANTAFAFTEELGLDVPDEDGEADGLEEGEDGILSDADLSGSASDTETGLADAAEQSEEEF